MKNKIEPSVLKGTRDQLPGDMARRSKVLETITGTFQQFGYAAIETPILSKAETILGKEESQNAKMAYSFKDYGNRQVALPFDLTMPFARFVAANYQDLPIPFKRYQVQRVWRAERPQRGRLREFYQCDIDIIGSKELLCEAEITKLIFEVFDRLNLKDITIKFNSRRILNEILSAYGVNEENTIDAIRLIDKLDKIGDKAVAVELSKIGLKNPEEILKQLKPESSNNETLNKLSNFDTSEFDEFLALVKQFKIPEGKIKVDPSLARGLDYYTGIIFEVVSNDSTLGTICAGGRYDNLGELFSDKDFSGVGVSFGFERIMLLMEELKLLKPDKSSSKALVTVFDKDSLSDSIKLYNILISAGLSAEIYLEDSKLSKQLKFADKKNIPFVVVQGPDEKSKGEVLVRSMSSGNQKSLPANQLATYISGYYESS